MIRESACPVRMLLTACALGLLGGCASPQYRTVYQYQPPAQMTAMAENCLNQCQQRQVLCESDCAVRTRECVQQAEQRARLEYAIAEENYEQDYRRWQIEDRLYRVERLLRDQHKSHLKQRWLDAVERCRVEKNPPGACTEMGHYKYELDHYERHYDYRPDAPERPSLERLTARAAQACAGDCGCTESFNRCYATCGGRVQAQQQCIANCPDTPAPPPK